jgi:hypothetical protein
MFYAASWRGICRPLFRQLAGVKSEAATDILVWLVELGFNPNAAFCSRSTPNFGRVTIGNNPNRPLHLVCTLTSYYRLDCMISLIPIFSVMFNLFFVD